MLSWQNLTVTVPGKEPKTLLSGCQGFVQAGEILALMGPSGAGKSTLFSCLGMRGKVRKLEIEGERLMDGVAYDKRQFQRCAGYVAQHEMMHSHITVVEALRTSARLLLSRTMDEAERESRVQTALDELDLRRCEKTRIGGISGGEKKRLAVAKEMLKEPRFLFLDEPTSGLDAASSLGLFVMLRKLADRGCAVICVLHQPRTTILDYVDRFLLLSCGRDLFFGPMPSLLDFFESQGHPVPRHANPLDFALDLVNTNESMNAVALQVSQAGLQERSSLPFGGAHSRQEIAEELMEAYRESGIYDKLLADATFRSSNLLKNNDSLIEQESHHFGGAPFLVRLWTLLTRETRSKVRNMDVLVTELMEAVLMGVILGTVYLQLSPGDSFNISISVAFVTVMALFLVFHVILIFPVERGIWLAENDNGLYRSLEYYLSAAVSSLPGDIVASVLLASIFYWLVGLRPDAGAFFIFMAFIILVCMCTSALFFVSSAIAPSMTTANTIASMVLIFVLLFNGIFIRGDQVPAVYAWIKEINYVAFANQAILYTQFRGLEVNCTEVFCDIAVPPGQNYGDAVLTALGISLDLSVGLNVVYSLCVWLGLNLLAFVFVTFMYTGLLSDIVDRAKKWWSVRRAEKKSESSNVNPGVIRVETLEIV